MPEQTTAAAAPETTVTETEPETAAPASPQDVSAPTYIGGILVVNKSYPLPRAYDPGGLTDECEDAFCVRSHLEGRGHFDRFQGLSIRHPQTA